MTIIIFTDWDGVLNNYDLSATLPDSLCEKFHKQEKTEPLSPFAVGLLNRLCYENPDIRLVCSSVWRDEEKDTIMGSLKNAHRRLIAATKMPNLPFAIKFDETAPESWRTKCGWEYDHPRGRAIDDWLATYRAEDQQYIILDDDGDFYEWQKPFLVQTDGETGLNLKSYILLEEFIKDPPHKKTPQRHFDFKP